MKRSIVLLAAAAVALSFGIGIAVGEEAKEAPAKKEPAAKKEAKPAAGIVQQKPDEMKFHEIPGVPVTQADEYKKGNMHCDFMKFPKGFAAPLHTHTNDVVSVVVTGEWGSGTEAGKEMMLGPGGYQMVPGNFKHTTKCSDAGECLVLTCQPGKFDMKIVAEKGAKKEAPKKE